MINWILIGIICLAAFFVFRLVGFRHGRHKFILTIVLLIMLILVSTFYFVTYKNNIDITSIKGLTAGAKVYGIWLVHSLQNIKELTGNAVRMDWADVNISFNSTNSTNILMPNSTSEAVENSKPSAPPGPKPLVKPFIFNSS